MDPSLRPQIPRSPSTNMPAPGAPPPLPTGMHQYPMHSQYSLAPHTLPPLQHPTHSHSPVPPPYMSQGYRPEMGRYPPTTSHEVYAATSAAPMPPHPAVSSLPPSTYLTTHHSQPPFQPQSLMPPTSAAPPYPQPIAPAPPRERRPEYVVTTSYSPADNKTAMWPAPEGMPASPQCGPKESPRTQVVGSQGRRGILPSVPGRAAVANNVNGAAKAAVPAKDADGKFPCPNCNKTYLHAKHLKRHLLRHTGDRPYMCVLCKDTFSRSDILKRHFQKCSLRRGNPTGISHLSHPHAHRKNAQAAGIIPNPVSSPMPITNGLVAPHYGDSPVNGVTMAPAHVPAHPPPMGYPMQPVNGLSRAPEPSYAPSPGHARSPWMTDHKPQPPYVPAPQPAENRVNVDLPPIDGPKPPVMQDAKPRMIPAAGAPPPAGAPSAGHPNHHGEIDWSSVFQGNHDGYMNSVFPTTVASVPGTVPTQEPDRKFYPSVTNASQQENINGLYLASAHMNGDAAVQSTRQ